MEKLIWRGGALLAPLCPALVTCGTMENPNVLTVAWTGIVNTLPPKTYISVRPERHSYGLIEQSGEFVINLPTASLLRAVDFCGVRSGRDFPRSFSPRRKPQIGWTGVWDMSLPRYQNKPSDSSDL